MGKVRQVPAEDGRGMGPLRPGWDGLREWHCRQGTAEQRCLGSRSPGQGVGADRALVTTWQKGPQFLLCSELCFTIPASRSQGKLRECALGQVFRGLVTAKEREAGRDGVRKRIPTGWGRRG